MRAGYKIVLVLLIVALVLSCRQSKSLTSAYNSEYIYYNSVFIPIFRQGLELCVENKIDTNDSFFQKTDKVFQTHFVSGKTAWFDEGITDEPMFMFSQLIFDSDSVAQVYMQTLSRDVFTMHNFDEERLMNCLDTSCGRIYRKGKSIYLINSCWDTRLSHYFEAIRKDADTLDWDEVILDFPQPE